MDEQTRDFFRSFYALLAIVHSTGAYDTHFYNAFGLQILTNQLLDQLYDYLLKIINCIEKLSLLRTHQKDLKISQVI